MQDINSKVVEYHISETEINRRKGAFSSLMLAVMIGLIVSLLDFLVSQIPLSLILTLVVSGLLFGASVLNIRWQNSFARKRLLVDDQAIKKIGEHSEEVYFYKYIRRITVKRTVKGYIRQIKLTLDSGRSTTINGLGPDDFENLDKTLTGHCSNAIVKSMKEPIAFDHPLFYPILGLVISSLFSVFIRLGVGLNESNLKIIYICILSYIAIVGIAIFLMRPYYNLHGRKGRRTDIIMGTMFLLIAVILYFYVFR
jgi:cation transporter-like permease